jgi:hypothetical protein
MLYGPYGEPGFENWRNRSFSQWEPSRGQQYRQFYGQPSYGQPQPLYGQPWMGRYSGRRVRRRLRTKLRTRPEPISAPRTRKDVGKPIRRWVRFVISGPPNGTEFRQGPPGIHAVR